MDANKLKNTVSDTVKLITKSAMLSKYVVVMLCVVIVLIMLAWVWNKSRLDQANCRAMDNLYKDFAKLHTLNIRADGFEHNLRDYYIKTAYNACCAGQFKNDFVNVCALKNCIKQGCRCLDFEVYSVDNKPVIATSSMDNYSIKETYNSVPFASAMQTIHDYAFSGGTCPNPGDPLIIHLRIMSNNKLIYKEMANNLETALSGKLLGPKYSFENHGKNIGSLPLKTFMGKVIIVADKSNPLFADTELDEYVNVSSNSIFMRCLRYSDGVKFAPDMNEVIEFNKKCMSICLPDLSDNNTNPNASLAMKYGCQMIAMCTQNFDSNMEYYDSVFDNAGTAFILKPKSLRFIPLTIPKPTPQNPAVSYQTRHIDGGYYKMSI